MNKQYPLVEFQTDLVFAIGLVDRPAIESNAIFFSAENHKNKDVLKFSMNTDKMEMLGAAMIPNKSILRIDPETNKPYYGKFTVEDIRKSALEFSANGFSHNLNINHTNEDADAVVFQSYIAEEYHLQGLKSVGIDVPVGSWIVGIKIFDVNVWNRVKSGDIKGFSIEAFITNKQVGVITEAELDSEIYSAIDKYYEVLNKNVNLLSTKNK